MLKVLVITFIFALSSFAKSDDQIINYADFIHMNKEQQTNTIKLVHTYLVEYEFQYKLNTLSPKMKVKYHSYLKIMDLFLSSAHAEDIDSTKIDPKKKCLIGGWMSTPTTQNGKEICVHPKRLGYEINKEKIGKEIDSSIYFNDVSSQYKMAREFNIIMVNSDSDGNISLEKNIGRDCNSENNYNNNNIICNPDVYGLIPGVNKRSKPSALCINEGNNFDHASGINVSLLCQKALEKIKSETPDDYNAMMNHVIEKAKANPEGELFNLLDSMYSTCLCGGEGNQKLVGNAINGAYAAKIFPSRTCVGILLHSDNIKNEYLKSCSAEANPNEVQFNKQWLNFFNKTDLELGKYITELKAQKFSKLNSQVLSRDEIEEIFLEDQKTYGPIAKQMMDTAMEKNLCPIVGERISPLKVPVEKADAPKDSLSISGDGFIILEEGDKKSIALEINTDLVLKDKKIDLNDPILKDVLYTPILIDKDNKKYILTKDEEFDLTAKYNDLANTIKISKPEITCSIKSEKTIKADNEYELTVTIQSPVGDFNTPTKENMTISIKGAKAVENSVNKFLYQNKSNSKADSVSSTESNPKTIPEAGPVTEKKAEVTLTDITLGETNGNQVEAIVELIGISNFNQPIKCSLEITPEPSAEKAKEKDSDIASCDVKLKATMNDDGRFNLDPNIKFLNTNGESTDKAPNYLSFWYEHTKAKPAPKVEDDLEGKYVEDKDESEEKSEEQESTDSPEIKAITDKYAVIYLTDSTSKDNKSNIVRRQNEKKRVFSLIVRPITEKGEKAKFEACSASVEIPALPSVINPVQLQGAPGRQRIKSGTVFEGTR